MAVLSSVWSRLGSAARWVAPSAVAACAGALLAGTVEAVAYPGVLPRAAALGFVALLGVPALLVASALVRGLVGAWQPAALASALREDHGGMPRLAGWVLTIQLGALLLAWATFQGTWQLAAWTAFKPLAVGFAQPVIAVATVLLVAGASRPAAALFAAIARRLDARWRRRGRRTLLTPAVILLTATVTSAIVGYVLYRIVVRPRTGAIATDFLHAPLLGAAVTVLAHLVWARLRARAILAVMLAALTVATIAIAVFTAVSRPALTLEIWGSRSLAGYAIHRVFDIDRIRDGVPLSHARPTARPGASHPDIVLVTIDTVRADRTPPYGGTADMPVLRDLSVRGSVFNWAFAPSNVTERSLPSIALGIGAERVRERAGPGPLHLDPRHVSLVERLRAGGYETAGFLCGAALWSRASRTGLHRGFEHLAIDADGAALARAAQTWLTARTARAPASAPRPLFVWMHLDEPRTWDLGAELRDDAERKRRYDATLSSADRLVGDVLASLANRPRPAIVIVTSDHGEALGDHGEAHHGTDLYNSQLRVPLVIVGPGIKPQRIQETVSLTDLAPTILELAGFAPVPARAFDGRSFASLATGARLSTIDGGLAFAAMRTGRLDAGGPRAIIRGRWKLIDNGANQELYDLHVDPDERSNQLTVRTSILVQLRRILDRHHAASTRPPF